MRRLFAILFSVALTGCVHYEPKPLHPTESATQLQSRSLAASDLKAFLENNSTTNISIWPLASWNFEQLSLAAYYYHPSLAVARAQWKSAEAGITTAEARPNPSVTATPGFNSDAVNGVTPWLPSISFDVPIETANKRGLRIAVAEHLSRSAQFNISTTAWQVRSNLRATLLSFVAAEQRLKLLEVANQNQKKIITSLKQNVSAGALGENEIAPALIVANRFELDSLDARRQAEEARAQIAEAIGVPAAALQKVALTYDYEPTTALPENLLKAQEMALKGRGDVLSALADYAAAESQLQLEIAKQYPDVHISPSYQWDQGESKWSLGVTVVLPVLDRNQGPIAEAKARREEVAAKFVALQAKVLSQVELALTSYQASMEQTRFVDQLLATQRRHLNSIEAQQKAGALAQLDTLTAELEINATELNRLDADIKVKQALGAFEDAIQRPLSSREPLTGSESQPVASAETNSNR